MGLVTLSYGGDLAQFPQLSGITPWLLGFVAALLLFASVVAHELGHSFVALAQGIEVKSITLFLFGGLASLGKESETPLQAFLVAIAGPVVSLLLFGLFLLISNQLALPTPLAAIVSMLAYINLALAVFNLIPGLPLDGGNVLKSVVWQITGNPNKGVIFASRVGQLFGWLAVIIGALSIFGVSQIGSFWTLLIGFFLLQNAGFSAQTARVQDTLGSYKVEEAIIPDSPIVSADLTLREFVNEYVIGKKEWRKFLVTNEDNKLMGVLLIDSLKQVPTSQWTEVLVKDLIQPADTIKTIQAEQSLLDAVKLLEDQTSPQLTVIRGDGVVVGLLEKASVLRFLQEKAQAKAA